MSRERGDVLILSPASYAEPISPLSSDKHKIHPIVLRNVQWCGIKLFQLLLESEKIVYFLNALSQRLFCFKALDCKVPTIKPGHISR